MTPRRLIEPARLAGTPLLRTQSDARLVDLVRAGHAAAFEAIVQRYRKQLLGYCGRLLPASRAEDAVQQTFLKAYQAMISGDAELKLRPWLYRIAHNCSLNLLRQNGWSHEELDENMDGVQRPDQALELRERLRATVKAVKDLPERQRNAVLLREVEGMSYEEIALALGVGDGAVRQLLHRARATLRAGATAVTPVGLAERLAAAMAGTDPATRIAEVAGGVGAGAGAVKLGAAMLATGALATGAITGPLSHQSRHARAGGSVENVAAANAAPTGSSGSDGMAVDDSIRTVHRSHGGKGSHGGRRHHEHARSGSGEQSGHHHGSGGDGGSNDRSGSSDRHSGSGDDNSGSGEHRSGNGDGGGFDDLSGSGSSGSDGGSGSDDGAKLSAPDDGGGSGSASGGGGDDGKTAITAPTGTTGSSGSGSDSGSSGSGGGDFQTSGD